MTSCLQCPLSVRPIIGYDPILLLCHSYSIVLFWLMFLSIVCCTTLLFIFVILLSCMCFCCVNHVLNSKGDTISRIFYPVVKLNQTSCSVIFYAMIESHLHSLHFNSLSLNRHQLFLIVCSPF